MCVSTFQAAIPPVLTIAASTVASHLMARNNQWTASITLSKEDKLYKDAIATAAASNKTEIAEDLLRYFSDIGSRECYTALLFAAFDLIRPDVVEELSWRHGFHDVATPYRLQVDRLRSEQLASLAKKMEDLMSKTVAKEEEDAAPFSLAPQTLALTWG